MDIFNWEPFLQQWNAELLEAARNPLSIYYDIFSAEIMNSYLLGSPPAPEHQIAALESRIQKTLPPSYHAFLKYTNGWGETTSFQGKIRAVSEVDWFFSQNSEWGNLWLLNKNAFEIPDEEYFVYGEAQSDLSVRVEYLVTALQISEIGDHTVYLLNPEVVTAEGEWEAWAFSAWDVSRHRSFWDLMQHEYKQFLGLLAK